MKKIKYIIMLLVIFVLTNITVFSNASEIESNQINNNTVGISYRTHVQDIGWQNYVANGELAGTTGQSKRLEGINIKLENNEENINIRYQVHVQDIGWQGWKYNGEMAGTMGQSKRLEGIRINLENSSKYSVLYRVHVQDIGWQAWKKDGELAGTTGQAKRLEAIEIKIIDKVVVGKIYIDTPINGTTFYNKEIQSINVSGWKMSNSADAYLKAYLDNNQIDSASLIYEERYDVIQNVTEYGTIVENPKPGFRFNIDLTILSVGTHFVRLELYDKDRKLTENTVAFNIDASIHIQYETHVQDIGWQGWRNNGEIAGTSGRSLRLEAIRIKATNLPDGSRIKYKTHVQDIGWQGWKNNGEIAGTSGQSLRLEALKIKLEGTEAYSVMYRTHVQDIGWQEWCYDGEASGTFGRSLRIEAIEIKIVPKIAQTKAIIAIENPENQIGNTVQNIRGWIMSTVPNVSLKIYIDNNEINLSNLQRTDRNDVLNAIKGFGDEEIYNNKPGYSLNYDFSSYNLGNHTIKVQAIYNGNIISENTVQFRVREKIIYSSGTYGSTGLKVAGDSRGTDLRYYKYGKGPNVFFATFAIHGWEDKWNNDGFELTTIADNFYNTLISSNDFDLNEKWTIYLFPGVNLDGLNHGYSHNGPGRTTLYSQAPGNKGIDLNRCWQIGSTYKIATSNRNYNGTAGFQAYESQYLRNFLLNNKSKTGRTVLVDLHGWEQSLIGDTTACSFYNRYFPENTKKYERYGSGNGYLIEWARSSLGNSTTGVANAALIELPTNGINNHQDVINNNLSGRFIQATLEMLREM